MSANNDSAFLRMFLLILGALIAFTVIIVTVAAKVTESVEEARGPDPRREALVAERIKPVGSVKVANTAPVSATPMSGAEVATAACNACHVAGVLGAPMLGDKAAWEARLNAAGGIDGLTTTVITGKGSMPPRGGSTASDGEIRAAVEHMLAESGIDVAADAPTAAATEPAPSEPAPESAAEPAGPAADAKQMANDAMEATTTAAASAVAGVKPSTAQAGSDDAPPVSLPVIEGSDAPVDAAPTEAAPAADLEKGKAVYDSACFACHLAGVAGAPKLGDKVAWTPRIALGMDALNTSVLKGKGAMPPKGGRADLADDDIKAAVAYMVDQAK